jgi:prolyl-tRNA synthetase
VFCHRAYLDMDTPPATTDFQDAAALQATVDRWTARYAATSEMHDAVGFGEIAAADQVSARGIEVGHIFFFGTKYSAPMGARVAGPDGEMRDVQMGSYGIGPSRLVAAIIEASHDEAGIIWPDSVAPYDVALLNLRPGDPATDVACDRIEREMEAQGLSVLHDDRDDRPGAKFATADLIGLPWQVVVGPKSLAEGKVELKRRATGARETLPLENLGERLRAGAITPA